VSGKRKAGERRADGKANWDKRRVGIAM
jgi:hypothetical protein